MADALTISVILQAIDHLTGPMRAAVQAVTDLDRVAAAGQGMRQMGLQVGAAGMIAQQGVGTLLDAIMPAVNQAADFEAVVSTLRAHADTGVEQMARMRQAALDIGRDDPTFSASQAVAAMDELIKQGRSVEETLAATQPVLDLARADHLELGRAATISSEAMHQFGVQASDAAMISDVLVAGANASATSVEGIANALKYAGPAAHTAGLSLQQTVTDIALLSNAGIDASQAGTTLNSMLVRLSALPRPAADALAELAVQTSDAQGNLRGVAEILADMDRAMTDRGYGSAQRIAALSQAFGL